MTVILRNGSNSRLGTFDFQLPPIAGNASKDLTAPLDLGGAKAGFEWTDLRAEITSAR